jgi:F-type H+-transporting ATPase subunit delta
LANEANQISEGLVYSARKLSPKDLKTLEATFTKKLGHQVILKNTVQSSLLGGVKVFLEGKVYDGSLLAKLLGLEKQLLNEGGNA